MNTVKIRIKTGEELADDGFRFMDGGIWIYGSVYTFAHLLGATVHGLLLGGGFVETASCTLPKEAYTLLSPKKKPKAKAKTKPKRKPAKPAKKKPRKR